MFCFAIIAAMMGIYKREFAVQQRKEEKEHDMQKLLEKTLNEDELRQVQVAAANARRQEN